VAEGPGGGAFAGVKPAIAYLLALVIPEIPAASGVRLRTG
jgi:hypothetical protein